MTSLALFPKRSSVPSPPGWFSRTFLAASDTAGAIAALSRLHCATDSPANEAVEDVFKSYGIRDARVRRNVVVALCTEALTRVMHWDVDAIAAGRERVENIARSLGLSQADLSDVQINAAVDRVRSAIKEAIADNVLSIKERVQLHSLGSSLGLSQDIVEELTRKAVEPLLQGALESDLADRRYSPDDEASLKRLAVDLGVQLTLSANAGNAASKFRLLWEIENGNLPEIAVPISLQKREICHFTCTCSWRELRSRTVRVNYSGPTASIRIMKGVYWRVGSIAPQRVTDTNLVEVASGTLYVTNKRVLLDGHGGNKSLTWRSVFGQEVFADAIKLEKASGRDPYLFVAPDEIEMLSTIIAGALAAAG